MIGAAISLAIQLIGLMITLLVICVRLMIRGSILLAAAIVAAIESRGRKGASR